MDFWVRYFGAKKTTGAIVGVGLITTGLVGTALAVIFLGWAAIPVEKEQVGYRGVGMVQFRPKEEINREAVLAAYPPDEEPYVPAEGDDLAGEYYENVQVLGDVTVDNFNRLMLAITNWVAPEQGCNYCHYPAEDGSINFADDNAYTKLVARRMIQMTQNINENWDSHVAQAGVNCYTCHRGNNVPQYQWFIEPRPDVSPLIGDNTIRQNRADETVGYSSLPGDPLTKYLLEEYPIRVGGTAPRTDAPYSQQMTIQDTEWTYGLMFHFSSSLGVNCTFCHNSRAWNQWDQSPPQRMNAWYAIRMLRDVNQNYMHNMTYYPPNRLGPLGDPGKANCTTCHQGVNLPMYGRDMISNWPELATTGKPDYSEWREQTSEAPAEDGDDRADAGTIAPN